MHESRAACSGEDPIDDLLEHGGEIVARDGEHMFGREPAQDHAPRTGDVEHVFEIEHESVESPLAHQLRLKEKLAACAPDIGNRQPRGHFAKAQLKHRMPDARLALERTAELGGRRRGLRDEWGKLDRLKQHEQVQ